MRPVVIICLLLALSPALATAQIDSILSLSPDYRIKALWDRYFTDWTKDSVTQVELYKDLQQELEQRNEPVLAQQAWLLNVYYRTLGTNVYRENGILEINKAISEAEKSGWGVVRAECMVLRGRIYYTQEKYGPAFESMFRGYELLKEFGFNKYPHTMRHLIPISEAYYQFGDYDNAIRFSREALSMPDPWSDDGFQRHTINTIGLCFQQIQQYDSAIHYYTRAHESSVVAKDTVWAALTLGNLGFVHFLRGDYDAALPLLEFDFTTSHRLGEYGSAVNAALALAEIYLQKENAGAAEHYITYASRYVDRSNVRALSGFYKNLYIISKLRGNLRDAIVYVDSFQFYRDSFLRVNDTKVISQARLKVEVERHAHEIGILEAKREREILLRNGVLVFLLMFCMTTTLWISRINLKRRKEYELSLLQKKITEDELSNAQRELHHFTRTLTEKNALIESFKAEIDNLQQEGIRQSDARTEYISRLVNSSILTENDWREFRQLFDKVYPGFFIRLREKMPDLNPADIRLLALTKLQLAPKEMASMLGIGYEAIKKSRQRLRKKIDLPEEGTLDELVEMF